MTKIHDADLRLAPSVVLLFLLTGCHIGGVRQRPLLLKHSTQPSGTVTTGGTFAEAKTLAIGDEGMTLSEAIQKSIRPGVADRVSRQLAGGADPRMLPGISSAELTAAEAPKPNFKVARALDNLVIAAEQGAFDGDVTHNERFVIISSIFEGVVPAESSAEKTEKLAELIDTPKSIQTLRSEHRPGELNSQQNALLKEIAAIIAPSAMGEQSATVSTDASTNVVVGSSQSESSAKAELWRLQNGLYSEYDNVYIVQLKRQGDPVRNFPLELIRMTPAGDIELIAGDHVGLVGYSQTSLGQRNQTGGISSRQTSARLTGFVKREEPIGSATTVSSISSRASESNYGSIIDLMVLRPVLPNGGNEEYWFPRVRSGVYTSLTSFQQDNPQRIIGGDEVQFSALRLHPLVRGSQIRGRVRDRMSIEAEKGMLREALDRKSEYEKSFVERASVIPGVPAIMEACSQLSGMLPGFGG
ncbi:hypothetical protein [Allorhodopirellula solitaria]|uniref:Uncharacterized protein n=1 Tax=Allorhodopirellula solitaria TaxID=2527987 RepID=A0A5C5WYD1_9BACT|nr:hypothetical protein [Allorhodopirellula solitaria]TWT55974.1 hypothetical protein CA85_46820 [Allorhodopirellula solitaria]